MKILTAVLVYRGEEHTRNCIDRLTGQSDLLILDNGSDLQSLIDSYDCLKLVNETNMLVNPAFNQVMAYFLNGKWNKLVIVNSDFILQDGWIACTKHRYIPIPSDGTLTKRVRVTEGTPGVFFCLSRPMVKAVYPLPDYIKIWFGDDWIFGILRGLGYKTYVLPDLVGYHWGNGSQDIVHTPNIDELIQEDKRQWAMQGQMDIIKRINENL